MERSRFSPRPVAQTEAPTTVMSKPAGGDELQHVTTFNIQHSLTLPNHQYPVPSQQSSISVPIPSRCFSLAPTLSPSAGTAELEEMNPLETPELD